MIGKPPRGLFITGTGTGVGKTRVAAIIAHALVRAGCRAGVYKPAASGCRVVDGQVVSDDAVALWEAAGRPGTLGAVCPQRFVAAVAPHLAARAEGREIDARLLRDGLSAWHDFEIAIVEGAGGLLSPLGDDECVADLARDFGYPLVVVAANELGAINATLQTLVAAKAVCPGLPIAGIVLNRLRAASEEDPSVPTNRSELERRAGSPVLAELHFAASDFDISVDWQRRMNSRT